MLNRSASLAIQHAFSKPCLVNLISTDTHLVFSMKRLGPLTLEIELNNTLKVYSLNHDILSQGGFQYLFLSYGFILIKLLHSFR